MYARVSSGPTAPYPGAVADFLTTLAERVLIFDGAFGTWVQGRDLGPDDFGGARLEGCNENLVLTRPDEIAEMHSQFFAVGVDAVETATFGAFSLVLNEYQIADKAYEINLKAAQIAREVASGFSTPDRPRFVIGSIGPGTKLPSLGHIDFVTLRDSYEEQVRGLVAGGVDVVLIETVMDLLQGKAAIIACRRAMAAEGRTVPIMVQVTVETTGRMLVGSEIGAALTALEAMQPDVIGMNCATGPGEMTEHLRHLSQHAHLPLVPPERRPAVDRRRAHALRPHARRARRRARAVRLRVRREHRRRLLRHHARAPEGRGRAHRQRPRAGRAQPEFEPGCSSIYSHVPFHQELAYLAVGERTNANGSRKFRDAMLEGDWDTCVQMAREQVKEGAHVLDVCVDYVGRDGAADMDEIAKRFATQASLPLVFDSTEPAVLEAGLQHHGGKALLNSANLEEGEGEGKRMDRVLSLAREYGAAVICLTIDEEGQARDADWKLRVAHRIYDIATQKYGIDGTDLIFDALTFPLSAGTEDLRRDGMETIEAIRRIKAELPGASTILGLSNVSFGLKPAARHVLNSVFLHECREAGLDAAIVHAAHHADAQDRRAREVALDLIYDRRRDDYDPLQEFMALFENVDASAVEREDRSGWPVAERLKHRIIDGERDGIEADLEEQLQTMDALAIVNDVLLSGMKVVGELFGRGEMQLPFVLQSAETMKTSVAYLEPHMERVDGAGKGTIVLGTVKGDVHDIGKNLVDIILSNNGYTVHNLGIKVPIHDLIDAAVNTEADAIGMSGPAREEHAHHAREPDRDERARPRAHPGAARRRRAHPQLRRARPAHHLQRPRLLRQGRVRGPAHDRDAHGGQAHRQPRPRLRHRAGRAHGDDAAHRAAPSTPTSRCPPAPTSPSTTRVFTPPFVGSRVAKGISLDDIAAYVNETALFRGQWQFRPDKTKGEDDDDFRERLRPVLREQLEGAKAEGLLNPAVAWGYFAVNSEGNDLVVWKDDDRTQEWLRFSFPRQRTDRFLCISDFFRPAESGEPDYAAFHVVTMGARASEREQELFRADRYQDYLLLHGLSVEMTEALAELWHRRIREEWGFADEDGPTIAGLFRQQYRGSRYSWGYPACPDLDDQAKLAELLEMDRIGVSLTEEFHLVPEQSTSAIIVSHPEAKYFIA